MEAFSAAGTGIWPWLRFPTLLWLTGWSDTSLIAIPLAGLAGAALALLGRLTPLALLACYTCHLSIATVGGDFYSYPWDNCLLEAYSLGLLICAFRTLHLLCEPTVSI